MKKITRWQIAFLIAYPIFHIALSVLSLLIGVMMVGLGPADTPEQEPTHGQLIVGDACFIICRILWAPVYILKLPHGYDWTWIGLTGVLYGFIILFLYKLIRKR